VVLAPIVVDSVVAFASVVGIRLGVVDDVLFDVGQGCRRWRPGSRISGLLPD